MEVRELLTEEYGAALELAFEVFQQYEAVDYSRQGVEAFHASVNEPAYAAGLRLYGAFDGGVLAGVLATRNGGEHIALFFVRGEYHRLGLGRRLFRMALADSPSGEMTVNSSRYATEVYRHLGFRATAPERTENGVRYTEMEYRPKQAALSRG